MAQPPVTAYVALGSNLGDRMAHLRAALAALGASPQTRVTAVSPVFETEPVGPPPQGPYLNAAAALETGLAARALLERLHEIEAAAGRVRGRVRDAARTLDLDLLLYGDACIAEPGLAVPHPRLHERCFVLEPLRAIAGAVVHPGLGETIDALARRAREALAAPLATAVRPVEEKAWRSLQ